MPIVEEYVVLSCFPSDFVFSSISTPKRLVLLYVCALCRIGFDCGDWSRSCVYLPHKLFDWGLREHVFLCSFLSDSVFSSISTPKRIVFLYVCAFRRIGFDFGDCPSAYMCLPHELFDWECQEGVLDWVFFLLLFSLLLLL
jgi:methenyltetrahydromethanopterin cyclohydrolase